MLKKGGYVVYRSEGVCVISDIKEETFGTVGEKEEYYILTPVKDLKSTIYVPVKNSTLRSYMRELMNAEEITEMCKAVKGERLKLPNDSRGRNNIYREIFSIGDRRELMILVNTLAEDLNSLQVLGRKVAITDENAIKRAKKLLFDEFSISTDISSEDDVVALLKGEISVSDKKCFCAD